MKRLPTKACGSCAGTGEVPGDGAGPILRAEREKLGIQAKDIAEALEISDSFLHDLERGNRTLSTALAAKYQAALEDARVGA